MSASDGGDIGASASDSAAKSTAGSLVKEKQAAGAATTLTPSRFDAPLRVRRASQLPLVTELQRFNKMTRSWVLRKGIGMFLAVAFAYNAVFCPIMELHPHEEKCLAGLKRRRYLSGWISLPNWFQQAFGVRRRVWLFQYNHPLDCEAQDVAFLQQKEAQLVERADAANETLKFNSSLSPLGFGAAPLRPEDLPSNVRWKSEAMQKSEKDSKKHRAEQQQQIGGTSGSSSAITVTPTPIANVFFSMWISFLRWIPRTVSFNRPWGDSTGNSVQYNWFLFEPVTFSSVKNVMLPVRPVELEAPEGNRVRVKMLAQLYYRKEEVAKVEMGHMKFGEVEALIDYVAPQVCDAWLASFSNLQELLQMAPPYRTTATQSVVKVLPEMAEFLADAGEEPPLVVSPLTLETPLSLERSLTAADNRLPQEELLRRFLTAKILKRMDGRITVDDIFWFLTVEPVPLADANFEADIYEGAADRGNFVL